MSDSIHDKGNTFTCPNCETSFSKSYNYCPQCGQETHLHHDNLWGLITHFIGHYFHYDSKFWQTIKVLWFHPGRLTTAYRLKQRMRYIAPVSLYIFISVVFFLAFSLVYNYRMGIPSQKKITTPQSNSLISAGVALKAKGDSINADEHKDLQKKISALDSTLALYNSNVPLKAQDSLFLKKQLASYNRLRQEDSLLLKEKYFSIDKKEFIEKGAHMFPKIFFFMIPVMGLVLFLLFYKRKELNYTDHIIFALHYHTFWFSFMLFYVLCNFMFSGSLLIRFMLFITTIYLVIALKNTYKTNWIKATLYSLIITVSYILLLLIPLFVIILLLYKEYAK